jgi:hypothetical protein
MVSNVGAKRWFLSCSFAIKWSEAEWQKCNLKTIRLIALLGFYNDWLEHNELHYLNACIFFSIYFSAHTRVCTITLRLAQNMSKGDLEIFSVSYSM